jgi:hypothetical protein
MAERHHRHVVVEVTAVQLTDGVDHVVQERFTS